MTTPHDREEAMEQALSNANKWNDANPDIPVEAVAEVVVNEVPDGWAAITCAGCGKTGAIPPDVATSLGGGEGGEGLVGLCSSCQTAVAERLG